LKHPVEEVHYVELDPLVIEAAQRYLPPQDRAVFNDPRVSVFHLDGRLYVKRSKGTFDVIIVDLPEPYTGQLNRFYTQEFFQEAKNILKEGGIFSLSLPSAENYLSPELARRNASVYHTLRSVLPSVMVLPGDTNFFLASFSPLTDDYRLLIQRLRERGIENRWVNEPYIEYIFTTDRFRLIQRDLNEEKRVRLNRDMSPISYYYDMALWLSPFYSGLREVFYGASLLRLWWLLVPMALGVAILRWRRRYSFPAIIGFTGFAEMTIEIVVLLAFQALHGYVYYEVSLIVAAFMVGMAGGGVVMNWLLERLKPPPFDRDRSFLTLSALRWVTPLRVLILVQGMVVLYALTLPLVLTRVAAWSFPILTLVAGFLGGFDFPLADHLTKGGVGRVAGLTYGADLVGSCFGALLASALFIPVLGIPQTCYAVALLSLAGLTLLL